MIIEIIAGLIFSAGIGMILYMFLGVFEKKVKQDNEYDILLNLVKELNRRVDEMEDWISIVNRSRNDGK